MKKSLFWPMFRVALMFYGLLAIVVMLLVLLVCFVVGWPAKLLILLLGFTLCISGVIGVYSRFFIDDAQQEEEDAAERIIIRPFRNLFIRFGLFSPRSVLQQEPSAPPPPPNRAMRRANAAQLRKKR